MRHEGLKIEELRCASVLERAVAHDGSQVEQVQFVGMQEPVHIVRESNVLYIPRLLLQLTSDGSVPLEVASAGALKFEQARSFEGRAGDFLSEFPVKHSNYSEVCILSNFWSNSFFHWVTEELVKVSILERAGFSGHYILHRPPAFCVPSLACLGVASSRIEAIDDEPIIFARVAFTTAINIYTQTAFRYREVFMSLRDTLLIAANEHRSPKHPRIWLHRDANVSSRRELINADEVHELVQKYGFDVVDIATYSIPDQIGLAHHAKIMMGTHGAGFTHALFMQPRSTVIECFSPQYIHNAYLNMCILLRHRHFMLAAENAWGLYPYGHDVWVNCLQLKLLLDSLDLA